jgi:hypothetical protein
VELFLEVEPAVDGSVGVAWLPMPESSLEAVVQVTSATAVAFDADYGRVEDDEILLRYHGTRAHQRALDQIPPDLREYLPPPAAVPPELGLPELLVPQEYDRFRVPPAVWWINVWGPRQLATLGVKRVQAAPWARIETLPGGRLLLVATRHAPSPSSPQDMATLRRIVEALNLRALQEATLT